MGEWAPLDPATDRARMMDLMRRAADHLLLETDRAPDEAMLDDNLAAPLGAEPFAFGHVRADGTLGGLCCASRGFYEPGDWYIGLLLLDPAERGAGIGPAIVDEIKSRPGSGILRITVLDANPAARRFWEREGFRHLRSVHPPASGDRHVKHVHEWRAP